MLQVEEVSCTKLTWFLLSYDLFWWVARYTSRSNLVLQCKVVEPRTEGKYITAPPPLQSSFSQHMAQNETCTGVFKHNLVLTLISLSASHARTYEVPRKKTKLHFKYRLWSESKHMNIGAVAIAVIFLCGQVESYKCMDFKKLTSMRCAECETSLQ